jgi:ribonuclease-3
MIKQAPSESQLMGLLDYQFKDGDLLTHALTHPSVVAHPSEASGRGKRRFTDYERLEFLGDRVLGVVVAELLYKSFPKDPEGDLAKRFAALAREETLAQVAKTIKLGQHLRLSPGEDSSGGRENPRVLADACEALIGALYLDGGFQAAHIVITRLWTPLINEISAPPKDAKTRLQEWAQARGLGLPRYVVTDQGGPAHNPVFLVEVSVDGQVPAKGQGASKRVAEQDAAASLLKVLQS